MPTKTKQNENEETYTVAEIRAVFKTPALCDDWDLPYFFEDIIISALRGEYTR